MLPALLLAALLFVCPTAGARDAEETETPDFARLFSIVRSTNANELVYEVRLRGGRFDTQSPIHAYWILHEKGGRLEEMTGLERKLAYGPKVKSSSADEIVFSLSALPDRPITVRHASAAHDGTRRAGAFMVIGGRPARLGKVEVEAKPGGLIPKVKEVRLTGEALPEGDEVTEVISR